MLAALSSVVLATTVVTAQTAPDSEAPTFRDPDYRLVAPIDEDGDVLVSLRVTVDSHAPETIPVTVTVRGVDKDGFELFEATLSGLVGPGATKFLTDTLYVNASTFEEVDRVEVEE